MMDPLTLGVVAAALVVKASEKSGEKLVDAGTAGLKRFVGWLREQFAQSGQASDATVLAKVESAPDSPSREQALADLINQRSEEDGAFKEKLADLIEQLRTEDGQVEQTVQSAVGNQNVQNANTHGSTVNISYGTATPPSV